MPEPDRPPSSRFIRNALRVLKEAALDDGYRYLRSTDLSMLLSFLDRFDRLGWFPPIDLEKQRVLAAHDVIMHVVHDNLCFYEFCSKGGRGEREPWLSIFFHVAVDSQIRICGIEQSRRLNRHRVFYLERIESRVELLQEWLNRHKER